MGTKLIFPDLSQQMPEHIPASVSEGLSYCTSQAFSGLCICFYWPTPWSRALEQLTVFQVVAKFTFYGTQSFIAMLTWAHHFPIFWARWIQSTPRSSKWRLFFRFCNRNFVCMFFFLMCALPCSSHRSWFEHHNNIQWGVQVIKLCYMLMNCDWMSTEGCVMSWTRRTIVKRVHLRQPHMIGLFLGGSLWLVFDEFFLLAIKKLCIPLVLIMYICDIYNWSVIK